MRTKAGPCYTWGVGEANAGGSTRKLREAFIEKFGREPGPGDPVIFDSDYDTPVPLSEEKFRALTLEAMRDAGIPPHLVYAYEKMGFVVNEQRYQQMSPAARAQYIAAIKEYFAMEESNKHRTDPQWYAFASSRDDPSGERDLRFGFGDEDEATEYLRLLNKHYDGRYDMRPRKQWAICSPTMKCRRKKNWRTPRDPASGGLPPLLPRFGGPGPIFWIEPQLLHRGRIETDRVLIG
jgi:hypothetical protein